MSTTARRLTPQDVERAEALWLEYLRSHPIIAEEGSAAGIDPDSGRIWFGESIVDIAAQQEAEGVYIPLHFVRLGSETYYRKGGRR